MNALPEQLTPMLTKALLVAFLLVGGLVARSQDLGSQPGPTVASLAQSKAVEWGAVGKSYEVFEKRLNTIEELKVQLEALQRQRGAVESEVTYIKSKIDRANRKLSGAKSADDTEQSYAETREKWNREAKAWESRLAQAKEQIGQLANEEKHLLAALKEAAKVTGHGAADVVIPSETLEVIVSEDDSLNGLYQVRRGGYIIMPRVGRIFVAGKALREVEAGIKAELEATQLRRATVIVERAQGLVAKASESPGNNVIYLAGEVLKTGPWPIPSGFQPTIVTTLLRSGGLTDAADLERVRVLRLVQGRALVEEVNVKEIMDGAGLASDYALMPGDIVTVPAVGVATTVHLTGEVKNPGLVKLDAKVQATLVTTLLKSGGVTEGADLENVRVLRLVKGRATVHVLNAKEIIDGGKPQPDFSLQPDDIIMVPTKGLPKRVFLTGNITNPGFVELRPSEDATVYSTIVRTGGFARFANLRKTYVLRDMGDGMRTRIPVNIKAVKQGNVPDLILEDSDIVVVPEKFFSF